MAGVEIVGLIGAAITIFDTVLKTYGNIKQANGLPVEFREAARRLPLVLDTLRSVETRITDGDVDLLSCQALKDVVDACRNRAKCLEKVFTEVAPRSASSKASNYRVALRSVGKGRRVESLMQGILKDVQLLAGNNAVKGATNPQVQKLQQAINETSERHRAELMTSGRHSLPLSAPDSMLHCISSWIQGILTALFCNR
jgi:hypothetical protein